MKLKMAADYMLCLHPGGQSQTRYPAPFQRASAGVPSEFNFESHDGPPQWIDGFRRRSLFPQDGEGCGLNHVLSFQRGNFLGAVPQLPENFIKFNAIGTTQLKFWR